MSDFDSKFLHTFLTYFSPSSRSFNHYVCASDHTFFPAVAIVIIVKLKIWVCTIMNKGARF